MWFFSTSHWSSPFEKNWRSIRGKFEKTQVAISSVGEFRLWSMAILMQNWLKVSLTVVYSWLRELLISSLACLSRIPFFFSFNVIHKSMWHNLMNDWKLCPLICENCWLCYFLLTLYFWCRFLTWYCRGYRLLLILWVIVWSEWWLLWLPFSSSAHLYLPLTVWVWHLTLYTCQPIADWEIPFPLFTPIS